MTVEVAYAKPDRQVVLRVELREDMTAEDAIRESGILELFPEISLNDASVGIYGKVCPLIKILRDGDRVEIYRPLIADPRISRRQRVVRR